MFYKKNLPVWERIARLVAAALLGLCALNYSGTPAAWVFGILGLVLGATSVVGFCPMCAMAGRKLRMNQK